MYILHHTVIFSSSCSISDFQSSEVSGFQFFEWVFVPFYHFIVLFRHLRPFKMIQDFDEFKDEHPWGSGNKMANIG